MGVTDDEALAGQAEIAKGEGLFVETSSAVVLPALRILRTQGVISDRETVVAVLTGSGFRDTHALATLRSATVPELTSHKSLEQLANSDLL